MLLVKTRVDKSTIDGAGVGLFAAENILPGELIWEFNPMIDKIFKEQDFELLPEAAVDFIKKYAFLEKERYILSGDNDRFQNCSLKDRNMVVKHGTNDITDSVFASRYIRDGEELFSWYEDFDERTFKELSDLWSGKHNIE